MQSIPGDQSPTEKTTTTSDKLEESVSQTPPLIPDHELLRRIGRGAYGSVWLGRNVMGTFRAIKIIYRRNFDSARPFEREYVGIEKFEPVSRSHPSQLAVLHVGRSSEYFYYVMEMADDIQQAKAAEPGSELSNGKTSSIQWEHYVPRTLREELKRRGRLSVEECMELGLALSTALDHLHRHGLVHRDIKPSNIVYINGLPKLADIGLVAEADSTLSFVGTEGFIPPEGPGTVQADIYGLGKTLYEAVTGKDRQQFPEPPSLLGAGESSAGLRELNSIILRACQRDLTKRYQTAAEMHSDLLLAQSGKSVQRLHKLERALQLALRGGVLVAVLAALGFWGFYHERSHSRVLAKLAGDNENLAAERREQLVRASVANGLQLIQQNDHFEALSWFVEALRLERGVPEKERIHRLRIAATLAHAPKLRQFWFHNGPVTCAEFDRSGARVLSGSQDGTARVWDVSSGRQMAVLEHGAEILGAHFSPDGERIVTAGADGSAVIWKADREQVQRVRLAHGPVVNTAKFSPDGRYVATGSSDGTARIWSAIDGAPVTPLLSQGGRVVDLDFSPDGRKLATLGATVPSCIWEVPTGVLLGKLSSHRFAYTIRFSPDGRKILIGAWGVALLHSAEPGGEVLARFPHEQAVHTAFFSPDGKWVVTASEDRTARVWEVATGMSPLAPFQSSHAFQWAAFNPEQGHIITADRSGEAEIWDLETGNRVGVRLRHGGPVVSATFSPDGRLALTAARDGAVRVWDLATLIEGGLTLKAPGFVHAMSVSSDGKQLATAHGASAQIWNLDGGTFVTKPISHGAIITDVCFSPDNSRIVTTGFDGAARIWEARTGSAVGGPLLHTGVVLRAVFRQPDRLVTASVLCRDVQNKGWQLSTATLNYVAGANCIAYRDHRTGIRTLTGPILLQTWDPISGQAVTSPIALEGSTGVLEFQAQHGLAATGTENGEIIVWDTASGRPVSAPFRPMVPVNGVKFSADGQYLVTFSGAELGRPTLGEARVWELASGSPVGPPLVHSNAVLAASFSSDARWIVTSCMDGSARIWDPRTGRMREPAMTHSHHVFDASFSPDDRLVVTGSGDRTARIWEAETGEALTPPLWHRGYVIHALFARSPWRVITSLHQSIVPANLEQSAHIWDLAPDQSALEDLQKLAALLSGRKFEPTGRRAEVGAEERERFWADLRDRRPEYLTPDERVHVKWRLRQIDHSFRRGRISQAETQARLLLESAPEDQETATLLANLDRAIAARPKTRSFAPRDPKSLPNQIDLTGFYTASLEEDWLAEKPRIPPNLLPLHPGLGDYAGITFDARGVIQLSGKAAVARKLAFPDRVGNIPVNLKCKKLHFLHGAVFVEPVAVALGRYSIHYEDGLQVSFPVVNGTHVRDWWSSRSTPVPVSKAAIAWTASNDWRTLQLFAWSVDNPFPDKRVDYLDLTSTGATGGLFVVAITVE